MFSKMDGIFGTLPPRHVESANTRLEIRRDESQSRNKKKDNGAESEAVAIPWEETAYISIASLKAFLLSTLPSNPEAASFTPIHEATSTVNARAANAYQSVGRAVHDSNIPPPQAPPPQSDSSSVDSHFTDEDMVRIRLFIADLTELERRGITELALQRSENFLNAIEAAIQTAKV